MPGLWGLSPSGDACLVRPVVGGLSPSGKALPVSPMGGGLIPSGCPSSQNCGGLSLSGDTRLVRPMGVSVPQGTPSQSDPLGVLVPQGMPIQSGPWGVLCPSGDHLVSPVGSQSLRECLYSQACGVLIPQRTPVQSGLWRSQPLRERLSSQAHGGGSQSLRGHPTSQACRLKQSPSEIRCHRPRGQALPAAQLNSAPSLLPNLSR